MEIIQSETIIDGADNTALREAISGRLNDDMSDMGKFAYEKNFGIFLSLGSEPDNSIAPEIPDEMRLLEKFFEKAPESAAKKDRPAKPEMRM